MDELKKNPYCSYWSTYFTWCVFHSYLELFYFLPRSYPLQDRYSCAHCFRFPSSLTPRQSFYISTGCYRSWCSRIVSFRMFVKIADDLFSSAFSMTSHHVYCSK
jgi:hypothetical protein